jgi:hypothetical protein
MIFDDILLLYDKKTSKKIYLFFYNFIKIKEKTENEIIYQMLYNNMVIDITFTFNLIVDLNDIDALISQQIEEQKLLALSKGVSEDFQSVSYERINLFKNIKNDYDSFERSEILLKQAYKNKIKSLNDYNNSLNKLDEIYKLYLEQKKKVEEDKSNYKSVEKKFETCATNSINIKNKIIENVKKSLNFDRSFKNIFEEDDAYKNCYGDHIVSESIITSYIPEFKLIDNSNVIPVRPNSRNFETKKPLPLPKKKSIDDLFNKVDSYYENKSKDDDTNSNDSNNKNDIKLYDKKENIKRKSNKSDSNKSESNKSESNKSEDGNVDNNNNNNNERKSFRKSLSLTKSFNIFKNLKN